MGDESAFNLLFEGYYVGLCFFASRYLKDLDLSRSLVQQVYVDIWIKRESIEINKSVKSYLYSFVRNRCIDYLRKVKTSTEFSEAIHDLNQLPFRDLVEEAELNDRINKSINNLPEKCREIFILCRFEGMKYSEIAQKLAVSVKTVEMQISVALKKIRKDLSDSQIINLLVFIYSKKK